MRVLVTGATGFIGRHVVTAFSARGHTVTAVARHPRRSDELLWSSAVGYVAADLHDPSFDPARELGVPDVLIHLAWPGLPNYKDLFHFEQNLPADYRFIKTMVAAGTRQVLITGTCFEYGLQSGALSETAPARPANPYGLAKHTLRLFLEALRERNPFSLQWARLFYLYGPGQNPGSLLAQLDRAIDAGATEFNMSGGEQLRDFQPVETAARDLVALAEHADFSGIVNCCSGKPISVRRLVEEHLRERGAKLRLNLGHFPYPDYEPLAFWGTRDKLDSLIKTVG